MAAPHKHPVYTDPHFVENIQRLKDRQKGWIDPEKGIGEPISAEYFDSLDKLLSHIPDVDLGNLALTSEEEGTLIMEWSRGIFCYIATEGICVHVHHDNEEIAKEFPYNDNGIYQTATLLREHLKL